MWVLLAGLLEWVSLLFSTELEVTRLEELEESARIIIMALGNEMLATGVAIA